jgi:hypothetical protein
LALLLEHEPAYGASAQERVQLAAIGIGTGMQFAPNAVRRALLEEAVHFGAAAIRANTYPAGDQACLVFPDRRWEWAFLDGGVTLDPRVHASVDRRGAPAYAGAGTWPAVEKVGDGGSQYLRTLRDAAGALLDGGRNYRLHLPAGAPIANFWSVVAYEAGSRSMLPNGQRFPSVSAHSEPNVNPDGSVDVYFGPSMPHGAEQNWIRTVEGKSWFPILRFDGSLHGFSDRSWKPNDIIVA